MANVKATMLAAGLLSIPLAHAQSKLPEGEGKEVVELHCLKCHGPENFINKKYTKDGWDEVIYSMQGRGLSATEAEYEIIARYCAKYLTGAVAKVNMNRASAKELESGLGLGADQAEAIVRYRAEKGDFRSWQDVVKVPGIETRKIEDNKEKLTF